MHIHLHDILCFVLWPFFRLLCLHLIIACFLRANFAYHHATFSGYCILLIAFPLMSLAKGRPVMRFFPSSISAAVPFVAEGRKRNRKIIEPIQPALFIHWTMVNWKRKTQVHGVAPLGGFLHKPEISDVLSSELTRVEHDRVFLENTNQKEKKKQEKFRMGRVLDRPWNVFFSFVHKTFVNYHLPLGLTFDEGSAWCRSNGVRFSGLAGW